MCGAWLFFQWPYHTSYHAISDYRTLLALPVCHGPQLPIALLISSYLRLYRRARDVFPAVAHTDSPLQLRFGPN